jgi:hypothetical protein
MDMIGFIINDDFEEFMEDEEITGGWEWYDAMFMMFMNLNR